MNPTKIQLYNGAKDNIGEPATVQEIIDIISSEKLLPFINNIRRNKGLLNDCRQMIQGKYPDPERDAEIKQKIKEYEWTVGELKKSLPAVTWSGTFFKRSKTGLQQYTGLICIDVDYMPDGVSLVDMKSKLKNDQYVWLVFTSPGGEGLKIIVKVNGGPDKHLKNFQALETYFATTYTLSVDISGKDISRLCFLSADNDFQCNYNAQTFEAKETTDNEPESTEAPGGTSNPIVEEIPEIKPLNKTEEKNFTSNDDTLVWVKDFTDKKITYAEGSRNSYVFLFACNANRKGFSDGETIDFLMSYASDLDSKEIEDTVKKAYRYNHLEHGKYKRTFTAKAKRNGNNHGTADPVLGNDIPGMGSKIISGTDQNDLPVFWKEHTFEKGKGDKKYTVKRLELWRVAFKRFLEQQGFFIVETGREGYQICHRHNGIIRPVDPRKIKNHVYHWCKTQDDRELFTQVEEMLLKGQKNYFAYTELDSLPVSIPDFLKDTKETAYFFFQNCYVKITKDEITSHQLSEVTKAIWDTSIIKRNYTYKDIDFTSMVNESGYFDFEKIPADMIKFIAQVATNPTKYKEVDAAVVIDRFQSICSSIGFMLHGWKNPIGKAVIAVDHKIPADKSEQNGGTGKSIVGKSFKYLKGTSEIDGRDFDEKYQFRFESIDLDTKIVVMADCKSSMDFGSFFNPITSDFRYNRRHTGFITIPYEDSPKWWFDSNFILKGDGASHRRRQHVIEFDDFYSDSYNPLDYFGHLLFQDWDNEQWNFFFNFYFHCVQLFLDKGLVTYPESNYDSRRLLVESNQEFIDWLDGQDEKGKYKIERNRWLEKKVLLKMWNDEASSMNMNKITPHLFSKQIKKYCQAKGYVFHGKKSNSVEYYMVATKDFKPETANHAAVQEIEFGVDK